MSLSRKRRAAKKDLFNLKKNQNYRKKTISELRFQDDSTTNNKNVILDQIETFYKNLYTSEENISDELKIAILFIPTLLVEDQNNLEGPLKYNECRKALGI